MNAWVTRQGLVIAIAAAWGALAPSAFAQLNPPDELDGGGRTAYENVRPREVAQHRPGRMVQDGLAQFRQFNRGLNLTVNVTETEETPSPFNEFLSEAITSVFDQVVLAIDLFHDLLNRRAGRSSSFEIPSGFFQQQTSSRLMSSGTP